MKPARPARSRRVGLTSNDVVDLVAARIERAIARRARYRYVHPRVAREGAGWKIASPNCSRNVDPTGGEIDIAWFTPAGGGSWQVHARDHAAGAWTVEGDALTLDAALALVRADEARRFWP